METGTPYMLYKASLIGASGLGGFPMIRVAVSVVGFRLGSIQDLIVSVYAPQGRSPRAHAWALRNKALYICSKC